MNQNLQSRQQLIATVENRIADLEKRLYLGDRPLPKGEKFALSMNLHQARRRLAKLNGTFPL